MVSRHLFALLGAIALVIFGLLSGPAVRADTEAANLNGDILTLDLKAKTLQVIKSDKSVVTVTFNGKTVISRNGKTAKVKALLLRDAVQVKTKAGAALKITATGPASKKLAGKLSDALKGQGELIVGGKTVLATAQTRIVRNGQVASLSSLTRNDAIVAHLKPGSTESTSEAFDVISSGPEDDEVHGTINAIAGNQVTVSPLNGSADVTLNVTDTTMIEVDGQEATLADLTVGMEIEAHFDPTTFEAFVIETDSHNEDDDAHISGTVSAVDLDAGTLTITPDAGDPVTLTVDAATEIEVNDNCGSLEDITVGLPVRAEYDTATLRAKEIKAGEDFGGDNGGGGHHGGGDHEDADVRGVIAAIDVDAATVTITPNDGGADLVLNVTADSEIEVNDHEGSIQDLVVGQEVRAEYFPDSNNISELKVENGGGDGDNDNDNDNNEDQHLMGTIAAVDVDGATVTVTPEGDGADVVLNVTADTKIEVDGDAATLADLEVGAQVQAEYDTATNNASEINVGDGHGGGD